MDRFDAIVIGGGPAGATAACLLARAGWTVGLLERQRFPRGKVCGEYLSATSLPLLDQLGLGERFRDTAGPPITRVGLFAGKTWLSAALPGPSQAGEWGRALSREHLDTMLLAGADRAGVTVRQPCTALGLNREEEDHVCQARCLVTGTTFAWRSRVVLAGHGSWAPGTLPTQPARQSAHPADLLGFKSHFTGADLQAGVMPLLAFPGGYGGMVQCDGGRVSLSCCIRRDRLTFLRRHKQAEAGPAVLAHIMESCQGARRALAGASQLGPWLAAGPIKPGIRVGGQGSIFLIGNAAGEAHPVVAEGISMALQGAGLLASRLIAWRRQGGKAGGLPGLAAEYAQAWRRRFAPRVRVSFAVAHWAMRPAPVAWSLPVLHRLPFMLSWGARLSGK
jgi:2-polyprenyl-6-methoxyphenol hydroxylase-like FAD-dependent oxidoreductase